MASSLAGGTQRTSRVEYRIPVRRRGTASPKSFAQASADLEVEGLPPIQTGFEDEHLVIIDAVKVSGIEAGPDSRFRDARALERVRAILDKHQIELEMEPSHRSMLEQLQPLPLYVAVNAVCNLKCWYCTEHGENRAYGAPALSTQALCELLEVAYSRGFRTFRFTGGEPTLRKDLPELMRATQALGDDVQIAITTNGARLGGMLDALAELNKPKVFLSVDGLALSGAPPQGDRRAFKVSKWLTDELVELIDELRPLANVRLNYVLTQSSLGQIWELIDFASGRGLDVKIFELLLRDFIGTGELSQLDAFKAQFVPIRSLVPELASRFGAPERFPGLGGRGMQMKFVSTGSSRVIYFDGLDGSHYSGKACRLCGHFPCQEGLYAPVLNASGILHPAGCRNEKLYKSVIGGDAARAFDELKAEIQRSQLMPDIPDHMEQFATGA